MTAEKLLDELESAVHNRTLSDQYLWIRDATDVHRRKHRCWAYPYADGTILGAITDVVEPARVLELGTALGYTSCWWAHHGATVDTIESDPVHVRLARENIEQAGLSHRVTVHEGSFATVVPALPEGYALAFFDGYEPPEHLVDILRNKLDSTGVLVVTNLDLGDGRFRSLLDSTPGLSTRYLGDLAISVPL